jgi:hypothetical protein
VRPHNGLLSTTEETQNSKSFDNYINLLTCGGKKKDNLMSMKIIFIKLEGELSEEIFKRAFIYILFNTKS